MIPGCSVYDSSDSSCTTCGATGYAAGNPDGSGNCTPNNAVTDCVAYSADGVCSECSGGKIAVTDENGAGKSC